MLEGIASKITEKTLVPISLVVSLFGGAGWLTQMHYTSAATAKTVEDVRVDLNLLQDNLVSYKLDNQEKLFKILSSIETRLSRIESKL